MIVSTETGGLGNRIKSWVSAMRLGTDACVYWPVTANMPARFQDLFANGCEVAAVPAHAVARGSWRLEILPSDEAWLPTGFAQVGGGPHPVIRGLGRLLWSLRGEPDDRYRYMLFPKQHSRRSTRRDGRNIDLEYGRIPDQIRKAYRPYFERVKPKPEIVARVDDWAARHMPEGVVGVQVRTWRDDPRRQRKYHVPAVRRLERMIAALPPTAELFVVSDSDDVAPWLATAAAPRRVLQFPRETARADSWQAADGIVEDLIDMLLLARARTLYASYLSTFGETAWWLGGARAVVSVF